MRLSEGTHLGPYEIKSLLGAGGMGEVYRARDPRLDRDVAIKVLHQADANSADQLRRFEQEARTAGGLSHPNILAIYDVGSHDGTPYVVSELLHGKSLREALRAGGLTVKKVIRYAVQIAHGLAAAHAKGIVHRDLKPENLFLTEEGHVKILDFGLAKLCPTGTRAAAGSENATVSRVTHPGMLLGTPAYMSPEQIRGRAVDQRSDIFSFGYVLYEMLTGRQPFLRATDVETMAAILQDELPALSSLNSRSSPALEQIVRRCLEKVPDERFRSANDIAYALEAVGDVAAFADQEPRTSTSPAAGAAQQRVVVPPIRSLAVLPLTPLPTPDVDDYLGLGLADALISRLSNIRQIAVRPTSAVRQYAGGSRDLRVVGRELNVEAVLEGTIQRAGDRIRVTVQLVDVRTGASLWGQRFDQTLSDILTVEDSISERVAESLLLTLTAEERRRLARRYTENTEAYTAYLKGRYHWNKRTEAGLHKAIEWFQQAIEQDPSYVVAYAGLADSYVLLSHYGVAPPRDVMPRAEAAASKAVELDEELGEPHATLGWVHFTFHWDWPAAEREFRRAIALNPVYATAHQWFAMYLTAMHRSDESMERIAEALRLDALSLPVNQCRAFLLYLSRRYQEALEQYMRTVDLDPEFAVAHFFSGWAYVQAAQLPEAIDQFEKAVTLTAGNPLALAGLGYGYAVSTQTKAAHDVLRQLRERLDRQYVSAYQVAAIALALGDKDQTYEWLERAYQDRSDWLVYLDVEPWLDPLRAEPRFRDLRERVGLP